MKYTVNEILARLPAGVLPEGNTEGIYIDNVRPIFEADEHTLSWLNPGRKDADQLVQNTEARLVICDLAYNTDLFREHNKCFIKVASPKLVFLRLVGELFATKPAIGIHPSAVVHPEADIHPEVYIGPHCSIGKCKIGEGSYIHANCVVYDNTSIGKCVVINSCTVIGADGFGYARNESGQLEKFPHIGGVIIGDHVEIGANTCIDKGTLGNTVIGDGVKIDNLVHIAHNVVIGEDTMVIANSMIGGSTVIGKKSWIAPSVSLRDAIVVGENVTVGMGSVVTKNIPDGETWAGNPARELNLLKKQLKRLEE